MLCKWCGERITSAEKVCGRCGRKIPALSDCGGFYDLSPEAPRSASAQMESKQPTNQPATQKKGRSRMPAVLCVVSALLVVSVLLQFVMLLRIGDMNRELERIYGYLEQLVTEPAKPLEPTASTAPADLSEPTTDTEPTAPSKPTVNTDSTESSVNEEDEATDPPGVLWPDIKE